MPMYRYVCQSCGNEEVHLHSVNESPSLKCVRCGSDMVRTIGRVGIVFKGSGFYITDSRKDSKTEDKSEQ